MSEILDYLSKVSVFGPSLLALFLILGTDFAFTLIHILQEWRGTHVPLWRVFGAVVGLWIPHWFGFATFTLLLCALQWAVGLTAIAGWLPIVGVSLPIGVGALGALIGARLADSVISHWTLYALGYRPNPGLSSTVLYCLEATFLLFAFWKGLSQESAAASIGFACGYAFFCLVLPALRALRLAVPPWRRNSWVRGNPIPTWATE